MQNIKVISNSSLFKKLNSTIKKLSIYPADHPAVKTALQKTFQLFEEFLKAKGEITMGQVENKLILEEESLEPSLISDKLWNTVERQNIKSISFSQGLSEGELKSFLEFFIKKEEEDFQHYFQKNKITHIKLNKLRYEVISEDEKVVKSDFIEKMNLKSELSKIIRAHPELLKEILLGRSVEKEKLQEVFKETDFSSCPKIERETSGKGDSKVSGGGLEIKQMMDEFKEEIDRLSDDEILTLLTFNLKQSFKDMPEDKNSSQEALEMINKVLEKRDKQKLLPRLKKLLSDYGVIDEKYFDLLIDQRWQSKEEVISKNLEFLERLEQNKIEKVNLENDIKDLARSPEEKLKNKILDSLIEKLDSTDEKVRGDSILALEKVIELSISEEKEKDFVYIKDRLEEQQEKNSVSISFYNGYFELRALIFTQLAKAGNTKEIKRLAEVVNPSTQNKQMLQEIQRLREDFITRVSSTENLDLLIQPLFDNFNAQRGKEVEELLENLNRRKVAQKLVEIFTVEQRNIRIWALRFLSDLGEDSIEAVSNLLTSKENLKRSKELNVLEEKSWYKVRNSLFVLGNIDSQRCIDLLLELAQDSDPRVRLEVLKVLEKKKGDKVSQALKEFLKDKEEEIRKKALNTISISKDKDFIPGLKEAFFTNSLNREKLLTTMVKIGEDECRDFVLKVVIDDNFLPADLSRKEKEELQIIALDLLEKIGDENTFQAIRNFTNKRKKGFLQRLSRDKVTEKALKILSLKGKEISLSRPQKINTG